MNNPFTYRRPDLRARYDNGFATRTAPSAMTMRTLLNWSAQEQSAFWMGWNESHPGDQRCYDGSKQIGEVA